MKRSLVFLALAGALASCAQVLTAGAAVVNGVRISQAQVDNEVKAQLSGSSASPQGAENKLQISRQVIARLIIQQLQLSEAARRGITADEKQVEQDYQRVRQNPQIAGEEDFRSKLAEFGFTPETFRQRIREGIVIEKLLASIAGPVSESQIREVYNQERDQFRQIKLRRIQLLIDAKHPDVAQHELALDLVRRLKSGANFAALARTYSNDAETKASGGGTNQFIQLSNISDPSLSEALWGARPGVALAPRKLGDAWWIFLVDAKRVQPFTEVRAQLTTQLQQQADQGAQRSFIQTSVIKADIIVNPRYGDWDPTSISIVPHKAVVPPDNATDENAPIDTGGVSIPADLQGS